MKTYGGVKVALHAFLTSALHWGEWSASRPGFFTLGGTANGTNWIGDWMRPRVGLDVVEFLSLPEIEPRSSSSSHYTELLRLSNVGPALSASEEATEQSLRFENRQ